MPTPPDPDKIKGPGGLTLRQAHQLVKQSALRDQQAARMANQLTQNQSRWQRFVRYVWDRKKG